MKYFDEDACLVNQLKIQLHRLKNNRKSTWRFHKNYVVTDQGEIIYKDDAPEFDWSEHVKE